MGSRGSLRKLLRSERFWKRFRLFHRRLRRRCSFLDIGCGAGHYGELLDRTHPGRFEYVGCDLPAMIAEAQAAWRHRRFFAFDLERDDPVLLNGYDVVCASGVIEVLPRCQRALARQLGCDAPTVMLLRQSIVDTTRIERHHAYGLPTFRVMIGRRKFAEILGDARRTVVAEVDDIVRGFVLTRAPTVRAPRA